MRPGWASHRRGHAASPSTASASYFLAVRPPDRRCPARPQVQGRRLAAASLLQLCGRRDADGVGAWEAAGSSTGCPGSGTATGCDANRGRVTRLSYLRPHRPAIQDTMR
ncbi:unnamed protein product [Urochloa humidicola]